MIDSFNSYPINSKGLFDSDEDLYKIPKYQRPYSWENRHIIQLIDDTYEAWKEDETSPYFLGSIILVKEKESEERYSILDGQQRITTLLILYSVFKHKFKQYLSNNNKNKVESRIKHKDINKHRLISNKNLDLKKNIFENIDLSKDNRYTESAETIIKHLNKKFENNLNKINDYFEYLDNNLHLVKIHPKDLRHAVKLFQTINTRGKDLTVSDLTKSYLLSRAKDEESKNSIIEVWGDITSKIDDDYDLLDDILGMYRLYLTSSKPETTIYKELKEEFNGNDPEDIIKDIEEFVEKFLELERTRNKDIFILKNLKHELYWKTILIAAKKESLSFYHELKKVLISLYYSYWIADHTSEKIKIPSINVLSMIKNGKNFDSIEKYLDKKMQDDNIIEKVRNNLYSDNVRDYSWHKRLLIAVEYYLSTSQKIVEISPNKGLHIEHILPKSHKSAMKTYIYWKRKFTNEEASELKNTLGNLIPLQYDLNSKAARKPFPDKVDIYKGNGSKPKSSFDLTLKIADEYQDWNPSNIKDNREFVVEKVAEILNFPSDKLKK